MVYASRNEILPPTPSGVGVPPGGYPARGSPARFVFYFFGFRFVFASTFTIFWIMIHWSLFNSTRSISLFSTPFQSIHRFLSWFSFLNKLIILCLICLLFIITQPLIIVRERWEIFCTRSCTHFYFLCLTWKHSYGYRYFVLFSL